MSPSSTSWSTQGVRTVLYCTGACGLIQYSTSTVLTMTHERKKFVRACMGGGQFKSEKKGNSKGKSLSLLCNENVFLTYTIRYCTLRRGSACARKGNCKLKEPRNWIWKEVEGISHEMASLHFVRNGQCWFFLYFATNVIVSRVVLYEQCCTVLAIAQRWSFFFSNGCWAQAYWFQY